MTTKDLVHIALFAAITAALALFPPITLPLIAVPITAQSMAPMLAGSIIGARRGALALVVFLVLVAAGMPLLSGGRGGIGVFGGPTAGYLFAWPVAAFVIGFMVERFWSRLTAVHLCIVNALGGIGLVYAIGIAWLVLVAKVPADKALWGNLPFLPGDLIKVALTTAVALTVRRAYPVMIRQNP